MSAARQAEAKRRSPDIVLRDRRRAAVILDIDEYQEMLERLNDVDDVKMLEEMREEPLRFGELEESLAQYSPNV